VSDVSNVRESECKRRIAKLNVPKSSFFSRALDCEDAEQHPLSGLLHPCLYEDVIDAGTTSQHKCDATMLFCHKLTRMQKEKLVQMFLRLVAERKESNVAIHNSDTVARPIFKIFHQGYCVR
jgi:hypothetical protein